MRINLISQEEYNLIQDIQKECPVLTFQNKGYEYIDRYSFTEKEQDGFEEIEAILKKAIVGFSEFNNFNHRKNGELQLRFQYQWTQGFTGVGYITLDKLLNGFKI